MKIEGKQSEPGEVSSDALSPTSEDEAIKPDAAARAVRTDDFHLFSDFRPPRVGRRFAEF